MEAVVEEASMYE